MLYPDVDVEKWCDKHKIEQVEYLCPKCGGKFMTDRPYITKKSYGLRSKEHHCGPEYYMATFVPKDEEDIMVMEFLLDLANKKEEE